MNQSMVERSWKILHELMLKEPIEEHMQWPTFMHDRDGKTGDLYSFLMDDRNALSYLGSAFARKVLVKHFAQGCIGGRIQCQGISGYLGRARELLNLIAAMMHLTGGGAPRAEEAIQTRILEGREAGRNLFYLRGKSPGS